MTRSLLLIILSLLLAQTCATVDQPAVEPFPKAKDGFGRPVWYNPTVDKCEDMKGFYVDCPFELQVIVDKPK